jgi:hypothetical protein
MIFEKMPAEEPTCREWTAELVECARRAGRERQPGRELRMHLAACERCSERWDAELLLTSHLSAMRNRTAAFRAREGRGAVLMRDFARMHKVRMIRGWGMALGAAAALVLAVVVGHMAGEAQRKPVHHARQQPSFYESGGDVLSTDASALSSDDFVAVPYTPPLAQGEMVRVVHAELYPEALASMGVEVDPAYTDRLPADVVVGEDGLPRAVRITENSSSF